MPNTQFIILLIITVFSLLAGTVSAVVLFGQLNAKKRERAELERKLENAVRRRRTRRRQCLGGA